MIRLEATVADVASVSLWSNSAFRKELQQPKRSFVIGRKRPILLKKSGLVSTAEK